MFLTVSENDGDGQLDLEQSWTWIIVKYCRQRSQWSVYWRPDGTKSCLPDCWWLYNKSLSLITYGPLQFYHLLLLTQRSIKTVSAKQHFKSVLCTKALLIFLRRRICQCHGKTKVNNGINVI